MNRWSSKFYVPDLIEVKEKKMPYRDEPQLCRFCSGSGEGQLDGSLCYVCHGSGVARADSAREDVQAARADTRNDERKCNEP